MLSHRAGESGYGRESLLELIMRFSPAVVALSFVFATVSSAGFGQTADIEIKQRSVEYLQLGEAAQKRGELDLAADLYETSLAADPRNSSAFIALAQIARVQQLPGKAIRLYREALIVDPNNLDALAGQGEALIQRGALEKAKVNLSRIETLCRSRCAQNDQLASAIKLAEKKPVLSAEAVTPKPRIGDEEPESETP